MGRADHTANMRVVLQRQLVSLPSSYLRDTCSTSEVGVVALYISERLIMVQGMGYKKYVLKANAVVGRPRAVEAARLVATNTYLLHSSNCHSSETYH